MACTAFNHGRWITQHFLTTHGVHCIDSPEMESTAFIHKIWNPQHLLTKYGIDTSRRFVPILPHHKSIELTNERRRLQYLPMREGVYKVFTRVTEFIAFSHEKWRPQYLLTTEGVQSIYTSGMELLVSYLPCIPGEAHTETGG